MYFSPEALRNAKAAEVNELTRQIIHLAAGRDIPPDLLIVVLVKLVKWPVKCIRLINDMGGRRPAHSTVS